ncbi:oxygenase [Mycolicibacterium smegmatis]|uniref:Oxygenase n=1 Tax=Mycolicibacterium smegmatis (strain ATCC 700084 / mc(2)155) TaxID=246196 RepID=A0QQR4_MYCS2|nr:oxygenase [Mycolicibacterium smegmatis MC2 155]AIU12733.1 oxygenase [Mycolicibacterium smegmatis]AIU06108.1 oxygenase [Mycolicibacterium smegmatis MC2 155]AIU19357.1 oxygenase [Mycolicibacterium smegmatis]TBH46478.1 oxygenase [Mycolicibacterium smegmatis MC2 155]
MLVVGAGPTGPMPACEPTLGGVRAVLLDERTDAPGITRAFAVHARTLQLLDARGLTADLPARGLPVPEVAPPGAVVSKLSELPTEFGMILMLPQSGTRRPAPRLH